MRTIIAIGVLLAIVNHVDGQIGIGTTVPSPSAIVEIKDSARGLLIPRIQMANRLAITSPAEGLMVYQVDSVKGFWYFNGTQWTPLSNLNNQNSFTGKTSIVFSDTISDTQAQLKLSREFGTNTEQIDIIGCTNLTTIDLSMVSNLKKISITNNSQLVNVNLSSLVSVEGYEGGIKISKNPRLKTLTLNSLRRIAGDLVIVDCDSIPSLSFPSLEKIVGHNNFLLSRNRQLVVLALPSLTTISRGNPIDFGYNRLPSQQINNLLATLVSITPSLSGFWISLGSQLPAGAPPTGQGIIDKNTLIANGNTINTD